MTRRPTISIAMATYNGAPHVEEQLDSLLAQTRLADEIVVTDDGSSDGTAALIERYGARSPIPIRVHRNERNLGYRANFMRTASLCTGDIIFFCDQDDIWGDEKLAVMMAVFDRPEVLLAYHNALLVTGDNQDMRPLYGGEQPALIAGDPWHYALGFTQAFRRGLLNFGDLWPTIVDCKFGTPLAHDQWFIFLALTLGEVAYVDRQLTRYRQHGGNVFGVPEPTGRAAAARHHMTYAIEHERRKLAAARARARVLDEIGGRSRGTQAERATAAAARYRRLAERLERRVSLYAADTLPRRLRLWSSAWLRRDYLDPKPWAWGWKAGFRDLASGVFRVVGRVI